MFLNKRALSGLLISGGLLTATTSHADLITLQNADHQVSISPQTMAIDWNGLSINQAALQVNQQPPQSYHILAQSRNAASWVLKPYGIKVDASVHNSALELSFSLPQEKVVSRQSPIDLTWFNLNQQESQTLILPFSEGMRVPLNHPTWTQFLIDNYSGSNTTQDLKMPFWTVEQNGSFISYLLNTATNNQLMFNQTDHRLDMSAAHQFTTLNQHEPFRLSISLGDTPLSGAKVYRQSRQESGVSTSLSRKLSRNPDIEKLIGASHVYLFGKDPLSINDVKDWWGLKSWYLTQSGLAIPNATEQELRSVTQAQKWFSQYHKQLLIDAISDSLQQKFDVPYPTLGNNTIREQYQAAQSISSWLATHARQYLIEPGRWGQALSIDMLNSFKQAGLTHLWLGFDNWMPSFYQPNVTDKAKQQGYLVAVYDSYNTALAQGKNDGWLTASLPEEMRLGCAIEMANGKRKSGFRGNGYYLNPNCHFDYVKRRMLDIAKYGRFNSIFLDVDATAMAREDYRDNSSENDMLAAFNHRLDWLSQQDDIVLGSEDGNSLTANGMAFAHGLETVGFGWVDRDMTQNKQSDYYLGRWYPDHKPEYFFKPAHVKQPYRTLLFAPQYRIPLYQAVFHDEIINSHHWHTDSLKFKDVKAIRDLTAMLYNTPAMVHLTRDEALSSNSPRVQALKHYQAGFKPIHQQLWDQALTDFTWLDSKGDIQQTTFSDGSYIIANFTTDPIVSQGRSIKPLAILAKLSNGKIVEWQAH